MASLIERHIADPMLALRLDVRRTVMAEEHGRRGASYLTNDPDEPVEVAQVREQVRALYHVMQSRLDDEQRWIASAVHDVKAGLVGVAYLLDAEQAENTGNERLGVARDEAKRLVEVLSRLTDLVRFSRLEAIEQREVDVTALLGTIVAKRRMQLAPSGVRLEIDDGGGAPAVTIRGDAGLLERAFANLIDNALRVARSAVKISIYPNLVRIEDDGPGLKQDLSTLTQPFRSETVTISGVPLPAGTLGLGLFIARRVLEAHGGRLAVERTSGDGTALLAYLGAGR